ncbi:MAG: DUF4833 domain-containing protein [Bacteroidetes bacterium]|jgi:hypothetical protein|nr:DUF4833 domain-containing protein [Bacteroidota bacterium]
MKKYKNRTLFILIISFILISFTAKEENHGISKSLFKIERSKDSDEIVYDINLTTFGKLNTENPINIYWIKHTNSNKIEPLSWIQKKFSYGLTFLDIGDNKAKFQFVSYGYRNFEIKKNTNGDFKVFTNSQNKEVAVKRIFIQIDGGTFWFPNITKVELHAIDIKTGKDLIETIVP